MLRSIAVFCLTLWLCGGQAPLDRGIVRGASSNRKALVVGNNAYLDIPLKNAVKDARAVSATLKDLMFEVDTVEDAGMKRFNAAVNGFIARLKPGDVALLYYSGHGIQLTGENS